MSHIKKGALHMFFEHSVKYHLSEKDEKQLQKLKDAIGQRVRALCEANGYSTVQTEEEVTESLHSIQEIFLSEIKPKMLGIARMYRLLESRYGKEFATLVQEIKFNIVTSQEMTDLVISLEQLLAQSSHSKEKIQALLEPFITCDNKRLAEKLEKMMKLIEIERKGKMEAKQQKEVADQEREACEKKREEYAKEQELYEKQNEQLIKELAELQRKKEEIEKLRQKSEIGQQFYQAPQKEQAESEFRFNDANNKTPDNQNEIFKENHSIYNEKMMQNFSRKRKI